MVRQVINKNQVKKKQYFTFPGNNRIGQHNILFDKDHGYYFSDDSAMDDVVNYFLKQKNYELVGAVKGSVSEVVKEQPKERTVISVNNNNNNKQKNKN